MKKLSLTLLAGVYSVACWAQLDLTVLENSLNETLSEVTSYFEFMRQAEIEISESSDVDSGNVAASLKASTKSLHSNLDEPVEFSARVVTHIVEAEDQDPRFNFNAVASIFAHTMPVLKNIAQASGDCEVTPVEEGSHVDNLLCIVFTGFQNSEKVVDLQQSLQEAVDYAQEAYGDGSEADSLLGQIFSSLKIAPSGDVLLVTAALNLNEGKVDGALDFVISEDGLNLAVNGDLVFPEEEMDSYIETVKEVATSLSDTESETHGIYEDNLYLVLGILESFLLSEEDY